MFTHPNESLIWNHPENMVRSRSPSKINDIAAVADGVYDDYGHSWLGLVSLMMFLMVFTCPEEVVFETRSPSKINDIAADVAGVYDDYGHS